MTLLSGVLSASPPAWARSPAERPAITARQVRGGGGWRGEGRGAPAVVARWDIDVTRSDDDGLAGIVTIEGSRLMQRGRLSGVLDGRRVRGSITDESGNHVASFVGALTPAGAFAGTYQDRTGEVGRWSWDGPLP